ncbi:MAG: molybdenum ABC transporter ATP-binding protein [Planctomycetes bacterium]|nr:molybdenum ABC transporter ATP-binding protein [Planctomycetota bacterium]
MNMQARFHIRQGGFNLHADLKIPARGVTALFGPSGCGKSSLLRAIAGLDRHTDGYFKFGAEIWQDQQQFLPPHKRPLGFVFQEASLFPHLNVRRNLEYGVKRTPTSARFISLEKAVSLLGIQNLMERSPGTLSGGEKQRVAIARALAVSPRLLLMDEPLAALDQARKQEILPYLETLHDELQIPILYVSHTLEEIARLADHLILFGTEGVIDSGPIEEMLTRLDLPLAHSADAATIFNAKVVGFDQTYHLTHLQFDGGELTVPGMSLQLHQPVRVRIAARDISLTLQRQSSTSIQNIFAASVAEMMAEGDSQVTVRLNVGGVPALARVTQKSAAELELAPGCSVFAQVKSAVLLG